MVNLSNDEIIETVISKSKMLFDKPFKDPKLKNNIQPKNSALNNFEIDQADFEKKLTVLFFYLYGLQKLDNNIENFKNRDIFLKSIIPNETQFNNFLNIDFSIVNYHSEIPSEKALFLKYDATVTYHTLKNDGQKASLVAVGLS
jgi:hypothetical protein